MCGRYSITTVPEAMRRLFKFVNPLPNLRPNYNYAPTQSPPSDTWRKVWLSRREKIAAVPMPHLLVVNVTFKMAWNPVPTEN